MPKFDPVLNDAIEAIEQEAIEKAETDKAKTHRKTRFDKPLSQIALDMNVSEETIRNWLYRRKVPDGRVLEFCQSSGAKLNDIAPLMYPGCCSEVIDEYIREYLENSKSM